MRGFYSVAAGMFTQQEHLNTIANNISNANTTGFKAQENISSAFVDHIQLRMSNLNEDKLKERIGYGHFMTVNIEEFTDYTQGHIQTTNRSLDMAINGDGFFVIEGDNEEILLTRNGQFELDEEGYLRLKGNGYVLNESLDRITLEGSGFTVASNGEIFEGEDSVDMLAMVYPNEGIELKKVGEDTYTTGEDQEAFEQMVNG